MKKKEDCREERGIHWQSGLLVSEQKKKEAAEREQKKRKEKKAKHKRKKTLVENQNVWKEKWRQSLQANSDHISLHGAVIKPSPYVSG